MIHGSPSDSEATTHSTFVIKGFHGGAATAPPEAILKPSLYPGSCWPMAGQSGQVTLRLPYPVKIKAITVDHAPSLLFEDQTKRQSAPKHVRVFGFPPCWTKKVAEGPKSQYADDYLDDNDDDAEYYRGVCEDGLGEPYTSFFVEKHDCWF